MPSIPYASAFMVVEINASDKGYGGILKQRMHDKEHLVRYHSGIWLALQQNYSSIKREILSVFLCISKFQDDLFYKKFLLTIDCKSVKDVLQKDVKNLSKERTIPCQISLQENFCTKRMTKYFLYRIYHEQ